MRTWVPSRWSERSIPTDGAAAKRKIASENRSSMLDSEVIFTWWAKTLSGTTLVGIQQPLHAVGFE